MESLLNLTKLAGTNTLFGQYHTKHVTPKEIQQSCSQIRPAIDQYTSNFFITLAQGCSISVIFTAESCVR